MKPRKLTENEVTFTIALHEEDTPIRGAFSSGDDTEDRKLENEIRADLESGNEWAWCCVEVVASWRGWKASDFLGACSYKSRADFIECGIYYRSMREGALDALNHAIACDASAIESLTKED